MASISKPSERQGAGVRLHNGVELHRPVPVRTRQGQDVLTQCPAHTPAGEARIDHEARGCDVRAGPSLVGVQFGGAADGSPGIDGDDGTTWRIQHPQRAGLRLAEIAVIGVGLTGRRDRLQEWPDHGPVLGCGLSDQHRVSRLAVTSPAASRNM